MFKVITAELKKLVSKKGIYVLAVLLAVILVFGVFIYKPTAAINNAYTLEGTDFGEKYSYFIGDGIDTGYQIHSIKQINIAKEKLTSYYINYNSEDMDTKTYIQKLKNEFDGYFLDYQECAYNNPAPSYIITVRTRLLNSLEILNTAIAEAISKNNSGIYTIVTTNANFDDYTSNYEAIYDLFDVSSTDTTDISFRCSEYDNKYRAQFRDTINTFYYPSVSAETIANYASNAESSKYSIVTKRLNDILAEIDALKNTVEAEGLSENIDKMNELTILANQYTETANVYINLVKYELLSNAFNSVSTKDQLDLLNLSKESEYNANSFLIKYNYLFDNNKTEADYANPLTIGQVSNTETNAYDYAYFILKLFSSVIIIYAIMMLCFSIAGETKEGTLRYVAVRPISRFTLYMGKLFAILIMSAILIIFSAVISLIVGVFVYGASSLPILTIFNCRTAITMQPVVMLLIYLFSLFIEVIIYSSIALLLSCLFKSDIFAVTIMLVLYIVNLILPMYNIGANSWLAFYPFSHISLYSFFGSTMFSSTDNIFSTILGEKIYAGSNIIAASAIIALIVVIINVIASRIFQRKEL